MIALGRALVVTALLWFGTCRTHAADASPAPAPGTEGRAGQDTLQVAVYFCLMVGLLGGALWFVRSGGLGLVQPKCKEGRKLTISETKMLGNRQYLVVAEYENQKLLLGVCPGRIDLLCPLASSNTGDGFARALEDKMK